MVPTVVDARARCVAFSDGIPPDSFVFTIKLPATSCEQMGYQERRVKKYWEYIYTTDIWGMNTGKAV